MQTMTERDALQAYNEFLDEVFPEYVMGNLTFRPSRILEELDKTAYHVGFNEWADNEGITIE